MKRINLPTHHRLNNDSLITQLTTDHDERLQDILPANSQVFRDLGLGDDSLLTSNENFGAQVYKNKRDISRGKAGIYLVRLYKKPTAIEQKRTHGYTDAGLVRISYPEPTRLQDKFKQKFTPSLEPVRLYSGWLRRDRLGELTPDQASTMLVNGIVGLARRAGISILQTVVDLPHDQDLDIFPIQAVAPEAGFTSQFTDTESGEASTVLNKEYSLKL